MQNKSHNISLKLHCGFLHASSQEHPLYPTLIFSFSLYMPFAFPKLTLLPALPLTMFYDFYLPLLIYAPVSMLG